MKNKTIDAKVESDNEAVIIVSTTGGPNPVVTINEKGKAPFNLEQNIGVILYNYKAKGDVPNIPGSFGSYLDSITNGGYLDSITTVAYGYGMINDKFTPTIKINPAYERIKDGKERTRSLAEYDSLKPEDGWVELDPYDKDVKYNQPLTREEAKIHPAWLAAMNNNKALLGKFADAWFDRTGAEKAMGFNIETSPMQGSLIPLRIFLSSSDVYSTMEPDWL